MELYTFLRVLPTHNGGKEKAKKKVKKMKMRPHSTQTLKSTKKKKRRKKKKESKPRKLRTRILVQTITTYCVDLLLIVSQLVSDSEVHFSYPG